MAQQARTIDDPIRVLPQAESDVAGIPYDPQAKLDRWIATLHALKVELTAAHAYPTSPSLAREWRRQNRSYLGGLDLHDELGMVDELLETLEFRKKFLREQGERS